MSTAANPAQINRAPTRRRVTRHPLAVPVDITIFRTGRPDLIPGRAVDIGEAGLSAVMAGDVDLGDAVGVDFLLPGHATPLHAKALVRHCGCLQCGIEFLALTPEQQSVIRNWTSGRPALAASFEDRGTEFEAGKRSVLPIRIRVRRRLLWMLLAALLIVAGLGWWRWHRAWSELESQVPAAKSSSGILRTLVSSKVMEQMAVHKVDPIYPDEARRAKVQGVVVLDAVIGSDGRVLDLHPVSGSGLLIASAMDAVKWWRFQPYLLNGQLVEVETTISVEFHTD